MYSGRFFARTTVIRSNSTQHCGYSVTFCKDDWDSVSIKIFASSFTFWVKLSGREFLPLPAHCTIPTLSFTSFCGNELVSVSCFFFVLFFFKPETLPPWSVPCWLYVRGFSRPNLPLEYCSVHFIQRSVGNHRRSPSAPCFVSPMSESRLSGLVPSQSTDSSVCMRFSSPHR